MTSCLRNSMEVDEAIKKISVCEEGGDDMNGEEKADGEGKDDTESTSSNSKVVSADQDILYVQDVGFNVKVSVPGLDQFTIQVSAMELVQEIHQLLMDREDTCQRTCFSLQLNGVTLDNFAELKTVEGLKEGSILKVVEEPYTVREARIHVRHVRDLLKSVDNSDAYQGLDCASLSFLNTLNSHGTISGDILDQKHKWGRSGRNQGGSTTGDGGIDCTPSDYLLPSGYEKSSNGSENPMLSPSSPGRPPLLPLHPPLAASTSSGGNRLICLKVLTTSAWNPPPGARRLHGDLLYIFVVTLEDKRFHITASTRGFFINQSTEQEFNPKASSPNYLCHSLIDLLSQISPLFKKNFSQLQRKRTSRHPFERVATPYQVFSWLSPIQEHTIDAIRAEDAFSSKLGYEEHIPGQTRDWNEELQTTRELPRKTLPERLLRERAIFKVHSDFVSAATRGATAVIDGNVMAINPGEDPKMQMFIWNNIFFSLGFDVRDHYKDLGGDAAAFIAPRNDLQGVKVYNAVDLEGLYTLGTVVVDYRGYRVTAQSIIPGILEREQEQSVVYGSIDFGKTVVSHSKYLDLLQKAGSQLKILPHAVVNDKEEEILLCSSVECKGIIGNDGRHYILDLLRTFPPDVNFLQLDEDVVDLSKEAKALGFPVVHAHKLACLRQELIDAFVESSYMRFIKYAAAQLQQLGRRKQMDLLAVKNKEDELPLHASGTLQDKGEVPGEASDDKDMEHSKNKSVDAEKPMDSNIKAEKKTSSSGNGKMEDDEAKKIVESITDSITSGEKRDIEESTKDIVRKAAMAVGSLKETEFDIRFNPDVFSPGVKHAPGERDSYKKQIALIRDASDFLITTQIPAFIRDCLDHSSVPMDGQTLADNLHNRGINIRYLGVIANMLSKVPQLCYIHSITVSEVIVRSAKHIFTSYLQNLDMTCLSAAISHFLNCFFAPNVLPINGGSGVGCGSAPLGSNNSNSVTSSSASADYKVSKKRNKKRSGKPTGSSGDMMDWATMSSKSLWKLLNQEMLSYYNFDLNMDNMDEICALFGLQKVSILRAFCQQAGIQLQLREYFSCPANLAGVLSPFCDDDVLNMFPRAKHINPRASDAYNFYTTGQSKIQQGYLKDGYELISEALNLLNNVYGAMHPEIAQCLRMLARLNYIMGDHAEAMSYQQKAVLMSERVNGIDHPYTITEYVHLALYAFANSQISTSLKLLYRSRYLCLLVFGEQHPEVSLIDSNIGLILHAVGEYDLSLKFLGKSLELNKRFHGEQSLKVAVSYHLVARTQSCMGDFRSALQNEKETYAIYRSQLGDEHEKTKESSECLRHLTEQAVVLQKKMNEIYSGKTKTSLPPIQIQPPSMGSVLDMLNIINGILFVQISQADIDNFKQEFEKRAGQQRPLDTAIEGSKMDKDEKIGPGGEEEGLKS